MKSLKEIPNFPDYWLSETGEIFKKLKPQINKGYRKITLCKNKIHKQKEIHRLMAEVFLACPEGKNRVNHKNGNRSDNRLENLEWVTHQENLIHARDVLKRGLGQKPIICIDTGEVFPSIEAAARSVGVISANLSHHLRNPEERPRVGKKRFLYVNRLK